MFTAIFSSKNFKALVFTVIGLYALLLISFYLLSDKLIFQRTELPTNHKFSFNFHHEEFFIAMPDQTVINVLYFKASGQPKGLVFYLHGNAGNLARWGNYALDFTQLGYDVVMFDYRGYGKSTGTPNTENIKSDALGVFNWVKSKFNPTHIITYGRSLGSTVASELATKINPDLLILETPFAEFQDVVYWPIIPALYLFPFEINLSNTSSLSKVTCRKIIFHGTNDWVVPLSSALKLKPLLNQQDDFIIIEGGGHRDLREFKKYHTKLAEILK